MVINVSDSASNRNEQIENAARAIGKSAARQSVFLALHHGKKATKTVRELASSTGLSEKQVLIAAKRLVKKQLFQQLPDRIDGRTAYEKNPFLQEHKALIISLAQSNKKLESLPTKRNTRVTVVSHVSVPVSTANVEQITVDDIANFRKVQSLTASDHLPSTLSEKAFKKGIQRILGEPGAFTDWGGEKNDLLSTRLVLQRRRRTVAFGFKGPGTKGVLTPKKMGKNGNQIQHLFHSPADVFIVQYWQEIHEDVLELLRALATAKSATSGAKIWFGCIDGYDSRRIYDAYPKSFATT